MVLSPFKSLFTPLTACHTVCSKKAKGLDPLNIGKSFMNGTCVYLKYYCATTRATQVRSKLRPILVNKVILVNNMESNDRVDRNTFNPPLLETNRPNLSGPISLKPYLDTLGEGWLGSPVCYQSCSQSLKLVLSLMRDLKHRNHYTVAQPGVHMRVKVMKKTTFQGLRLLLQDD